MKKLLALGVGFIAILLTITLIVFGVMHTRYFTPSAQWLTQQLWPNQLSFSQLEYNYPTHFTLHNVSIETDQQPISFGQIDIWLNRKLIDSDKLVIDSLLLDGANFSSGLPSNSFVRSLHINQLALHNIDFSQQGLIARGVNLQVKNPHWTAPEQYLPFGEVQLSADQFYWQGEAFDSVLIDADYKTQDSTIYGISFKWRNGDFSGQAEQFDDGWSLINTTVSHLNLPVSANSKAQQLWESASGYITHINSLDILSSHLTWSDIRFDNVAASLENITLNKSAWQQDNGYLSLNADSVSWHGLQWIEPSMKVDFSQQSIAVSDFAAEVLQGHVQLAGTMTPDSIHLSQLNITGIKWFGENQQDFAWIPEQWPQLKELTLDQLELNNLQAIQLLNRPYWQLSGLTAEGSDTQLIRDGQWGLWNGNLTVSANSASVGDLLSTQGVIEMSSSEGKWQLDRAFIPLENGYIDATANWDFSTTSAPWSLAVHADGLPFPIVNYFIELPLQIDALTEFDINAEGLAGDYSMFSHTLSGELNASMRNGTMVIEKPDSQVIQPFELDNIKLTADRGRIQLPQIPLKGTDLQANIIAQLDLVAPQEGQFDLNITEGCEHIRFDILNNQQEYQSCDQVD